MDKYIIIKTLCDKKEIVDKIVDRVLNKKLVVGCQIYESESKYYWAGAIEKTREYLIEMRTKLSKYNEIEKQIKEIHNYDVCEISYIELLGANDEFLKWIDENVN